MNCKKIQNLKDGQVKIMKCMYLQVDGENWRCSEKGWNGWTGNGSNKCLPPMIWCFQHSFVFLPWMNEINRKEWENEIVQSFWFYREKLRKRNGTGFKQFTRNGSQTVRNVWMTHPNSITFYFYTILKECLIAILVLTLFSKVNLFFLRKHPFLSFVEFLRCQMFKTTVCYFLFWKFRIIVKEGN